MAVALKLTVGKAEPIYRGQDHFWRCIRGVGRTGTRFTASDIRAMSDEPHKGTIQTYMRRLWKAGFLRRDGTCVNAATGRKENCFLLVKDQPTPLALTADGQLAPRRVTLQQAMWNVVRGPMSRDGFSFSDLVAWGSPVHLRADWRDGDIQIGWIRRTRIGSDSWEPADMPLGEDSEVYEVEILSADGADVVRTVTGLGAPAWLYQVADQTADFGEPATSIRFRVYQLSATFGRGIPGEYP